MKKVESINGSFEFEGKLLSISRPFAKRKFYYPLIASQSSIGLIISLITIFCQYSTVVVNTVVVAVVVVVVKWTVITTDNLKFKIGFNDVLNEEVKTDNCWTSLC